VFGNAPGVLLDCSLSDVVKYGSRDWRLSASASMKTGVFWCYVTPCNSAHEYHRLGKSCCLHPRVEEWRICKVPPVGVCLTVVYSPDIRVLTPKKITQCKL
jgi:hypothetical protein